MNETSLVKILMACRWSHGRAVAFEAFLDDRRVCGVSGEQLASLMELYVERSIDGNERLIREAAEARRLRKDLNVMDVQLPLPFSRNP